MGDAGDEKVDGVAAGVAMTRSKRQTNTIKLNNPYDEVTNRRLQQQMIQQTPTQPSQNDMMAAKKKKTNS